MGCYRVYFREEAEMFRSGNVGVFAGSEVIHLGANPRYVPSLVAELFDWTKELEVHPLTHLLMVMDG